MWFWRGKGNSNGEQTHAFDLQALPYARLTGVGLEMEGRAILMDLTLELSEDRIGIIGLNGSGKSSFVRLLNGLRQPTSGHLSIFGVDALRAQKDLPRQVGFVFQNPDHQAIFPVVEEDVAFGLQQLGASKQEALEKARAFLKHHGADHLSERAIADLSEGQKQLVAILAVLIMEPQILILDEPYSALDALAARRLHAKLASLPLKLVLISHDPEHLRAFDRVLWFEDGRLKMDGKPDVVLDAYGREIERRALQDGTDDWGQGHL